MSSSSRIIRNGMAATIRHDAAMQAREEGRANHRQSMLLEEARDETQDEFKKRIALAKENEALRRERDELAEKVAESEDLLLLWANSSRSYLNTLKFIRERWEPSKPGVVASEDVIKERAELIKEKSREEFEKLTSAPIEEQRAYRERSDAARRAGIKNIRAARRR